MSYMVIGDTVQNKVGHRPAVTCGPATYPQTCLCQLRHCMEAWTIQLFCNMLSPRGYRSPYGFAPRPLKYNVLEGSTALSS